MRRRLLPFFTLGTIILVVVVVLHTFGVTGTGKRLEFQSMSELYVSRFPNPGYYVIQSVDEWTEVFDGRPQSEVDFSRSTVVAVFMGSFRTGGYQIKVREIIDTGLLVVVKVEKTYPGKGCVLPQVLTYPYHIVKVDKINKYIIFNTITRTIECG